MTKLIGNLRDVLPSKQGCNDGDPLAIAIVACVEGGLEEAHTLTKEDTLCPSTKFGAKPQPSRYRAWMSRGLCPCPCSISMCSISMLVYRAYIHIAHIHALYPCSISILCIFVPYIHARMVLELDTDLSILHSLVRTSNTHQATFVCSGKFVLRPYILSFCHPLPVIFIYGCHLMLELKKFPYTRTTPLFM